MAWVRSGECNRCGECCLGDPRWPHGGPDDIMKQPPIAEGRCPAFRTDAEGKGTCLGHGWHPYYLSGCNVWPTVPGHIANYPSCSFTFTWVDEE